MSQPSMLYKHKNGISLRKVQREDLPKLLNLLNETWYGRHTWQFSNMEDQNKWFESLTGDSSRAIFVAFDGETPVGLYKLHGIDLINRSAASSHDVFSECQGKGYGYKVLEAGVDCAFEMFGLHRLDTEVLENNIASQKTADFVGYIKEGTRTKAVYRCGEWLDSITYGLLFEKWRDLDRVMDYGNCCNLSYVPKDKK